MSTAPCVEISRSALRHNLATVRQLAPNQKIMAVVKANAYGHDMLAVAETLSDADMFAVARVSEGITLRQTYKTHTIVVLTGALDAHEVTMAAQWQLDLVIHCEQQFSLMKDADHRFSCWLKVDTGMGRLGLSQPQYQRIYEALSAVPAQFQLQGVISHFANADDLSDNKTIQQTLVLDKFNIAKNIPLSLANSAAIIGWPQTHHQIVRPGLMLYGVNPLTTAIPEGISLQAVMTLKAKIVTIRHMKKGDSVGYGASWVCPQDKQIAIVGIGYGDGYPRSAGNRANALINEKQVPLVGRVSMDSLAIDVSNVQVKIGDSVTLWGKELPIEGLAEKTGEFSYELLCGITQRVEKRIVD